MPTKHLLILVSAAVAFAAPMAIAQKKYDLGASDE